MQGTTTDLQNDTKTAALRDGRIFAYTEHGDLNGRPVFFIHGNPGSRYFRHPDITIARKLGVRIISADRPGYGRSDYLPNRTLLDYPDDLEQLADQLEIDRFFLFGASAGGPYTAACAFKLGHRLDGVAIVSGAAPFDRPGAFDGMGKQWRVGVKAGKLPSWLVRFLIRGKVKQARTNPEGAVDGILDTLNDYDKSILSQPSIRQRTINHYDECYRQGTRGFDRELKVLLSDWNFRLEDIKIPVHLWYWEDDMAIPPQMGRYLESRIPHTIPHFSPGGGHLAIYDHWEEIIDTLVNEE